ncbi:hypothetical protein O3M35_011107 [Rhynocoris fuscipes]|uniref:Uncharacterized protein n=1 Tax=Rhynocoris fuscipes TaxID=488301 RepID=A0AAW1CWD1_9HEMI
MRMETSPFGYRGEFFFLIALKSTLRELSNDTQQQGRIFISFGVMPLQRVRI